MLFLKWDSESMNVVLLMFRRLTVITLQFTD